MNLALRIISALVLLPIVLLLSYLGGWYFFGLVLVTTAFALREYTKIVDPDDSTSQLATIIIGLVVTALALNATSAAQGLVVVQLGAVALAIFFTIRTGVFESAWQRLSLHSFALLYIVASLVCIFFVRALGDNLETWQKPSWLYAALLITWANDTAAYFAGRAFGKHKFYEKVSPKKTWEGFFGGVCGAVGGLFLIRLAFPTVFGHFTTTDLLLMGIPGGVLGPVGDLAESLLKRNFGVKDSGNTIPGHGGILDRIDALFFVAPWVLFYGAVLKPLLS